MKNILKLTVLTIIIAFAIIIVNNYIVKADTNGVEEIIPKETIELNNREEEKTLEEGSNIDIDIDSLVVKDEKYTTVHKTTTGEKYTIIGSLKIPKINIEYDILSSTSVALLKVSLNRYWGAQPNEVGNMCIVGHNYLDSRFFGRLHTLKEGDYIEITDAYNRTEKYYVYDMFIADPYDTRCTSQLTNGEKEITLITCYNSGTQRLVVKARAKKDKTIEKIMKDIINKIIKDIK